jgi:hypothetical protein
LFNTLELNNKFSIDNQVRKILADQRALVHQGLGNLLRYGSTTLDQLSRHGSLVHFLEESTSKGVCNFIRCPNNFLNQYFD